MARNGNGNAKQAPETPARVKVSEMSGAEKNRQIQALLSTLENTDDQVVKRNTRAQLRRLGHTGGLGERKPAAKAAPAKAVAKGKPAAKGAPVAGRRARPQA